MALPEELLFEPVDDDEFPVPPPLLLDEPPPPDAPPPPPPPPACANDEVEKPARATPPIANAASWTNRCLFMLNLRSRT